MWEGARGREGGQVYMMMAPLHCCVAESRFPGGACGKEPAANAERKRQCGSLGREDPLGEAW